jgi:hypothetical protein
VHFFVKYTKGALGDPFDIVPDVDLQGIVLGGWRITKTKLGSEPQGCMTNLASEHVVCSPNGVFPATGPPVECATTQSSGPPLTVLTTDEVSAAAGVGVTETMPAKIAGIAFACSWKGTKANLGVAIELTRTFQTSPEVHRQFTADRDDNATFVGGFGQNAFFNPYDGGRQELYVLDGNRIVIVAVAGTSAAAAQHRQLAKTLAAEIVKSIGLVLARPGGSTATGPTTSTPEAPVPAAPLALDTLTRFFQQMDSESYAGAAAYVLPAERACFLADNPPSEAFSYSTLRLGDFTRTGHSSARIDVRPVGGYFQSPGGKRTTITEGPVAMEALGGKWYVDYVSSPTLGPTCARG